MDVFTRERSYCVSCWNRLPGDIRDAALRLKELNNLKIEELNLSVRARNALMRAGVRTSEQLMSMEVDDLRKIRNIGDKTLYEVQRTMKKLEEQERVAQVQQAPNGSYLHGYCEGKEGMRRAVVRELTRLARRASREQQEILSEACGMVKMIEVL